MEISFTNPGATLGAPAEKFQGQSARYNSLSRRSCDVQQVRRYPTSARCTMPGSTNSFPPLDFSISTLCTPPRETRSHRSDGFSREAMQPPCPCRGMPFTQSYQPCPSAAHGSRSMPRMVCSREHSAAACAWGWEVPQTTVGTFSPRPRNRTEREPSREGRVVRSLQEKSQEASSASTYGVDRRVARHVDDAARHFDGVEDSEEPWATGHDEKSPLSQRGSDCVTCSTQISEMESQLSASSILSGESSELSGGVDDGALAGKLVLNILCKSYKTC